jgi:hypothetical protein
VTIDPHELAEMRSLAIHRLVARRLQDEPRLVAAARDRVDRWLRDGSVHRAYAEEWRRLLTGPPEQLLEVLTDMGEEAGAPPVFALRGSGRPTDAVVDLARRTGADGP